MTGSHVADQILEERTGAMHGIEALGLKLGQMHHARGNDAQPGCFKAPIDLADEVAGHAVGLDDG
jgi:hypothetical protein